MKLLKDVSRFRHIPEMTKKGDSRSCLAHRFEECYALKCKVDGRGTGCFPNGCPQDMEKV